MSPEEDQGPLLGQDGENVPARWKEEVGDERRSSHRKICLRVTVATLLISLSVFLIVFLQWNSAFGAQSSEVSEAPDHQSGNADVEVVETPKRDLKVLLNPQDHISRGPEVRRYTWNVTKATMTPDGTERDVFLINGQFPGPPIEVRTGDTLEVEILNLSEDGVAIHWHGLHMRGANHMDGPVGVTQCAINPGEKFLYSVPIEGQAGTFWYHGHSEIQRGDGLYGGLVIHSPEDGKEENGEPDSVKYEYDDELLFLLGDWYHGSSQATLDFFMSQTSSGDEPGPDSMLVNGMGYFECSMAVKAYPVNCSSIERPSLSLDKTRRYRVRLVNVGSMTGVSFAIPDSEMDVILVDGGHRVVSNETANSVGILYPAERLDFILSWEETAVESDTEVIVTLDDEYFLRPNFALTRIQSFALETQAENRKAMDKGKTTEITQVDLRSLEGPVLDEPLPDPDTTWMIYSAVEIRAHENLIPKGFINHTTWVPQAVPLISQERSSWDKHQFVPWSGSEPGWVELTINNVDATGHPFHLHGFDVYVIGSHEANGGFDYYNPFQSKPPRGGPFNLRNPLVKDTVYVPAYGYAVIRFRADNEGIWMLHCHVLWHQGSGMDMAIQVMGDEQKGLSATDSGKKALDTCKS